MKLRIVDTIARDSFHEIFNSSLLAICLTAFDDVEYVCHTTQRRAICAMLAKHRPDSDVGRVHFRSTAVLKREGPVGWLLKYMVGAILNIWYLISSPRRSQIIFTYNNPLSLWFVNQLNRFLRRRVLIVCHGELELLAQKHPWWRASAWFSAIFRHVFARGRITRNMRFCVLGNSILKNLKPYLSDRNLLKFIAIDHPYHFSPIHERQVHEGLRIGTVGQMTPSKGLATLLNLSEQIPVPISVVGRIYGVDDVGRYKNMRFVAGHTNSHIPRDIYDHEIAQLDYVLFAYDAYSYKLTASGALFDALNMGRPLISLRNDYFDEVLKLPIGYVLTDSDQMAALICRLTAEFPKDQAYERFCHNILHLRDIYSVDTVAAKFRSALDGLYPDLNPCE